MDFPIIMSIIGIFLGLVLMMFMAYKGFSIIWVAPVCASVVALFSGYNLLHAYLKDYMTGMANYIMTWFPAFFLGAVYGKMMDITGSARSLAEKLIKIIGSKYAVLAVVLPCLLMTYGGISLFVVVFVIYPMGYSIYRAANLPRTLLPGAIAFGAFGISMTALPGTPQIQNLIPTSYYHTTALAAPVVSLIAVAVMGIPGYIYLEWRARKAMKEGKGFVEEKRKVCSEYNADELPKWHWLSGLLPLIVVVLMLNLLPVVLASHGIKLSSANAIVVALISGIATCALLNFNRLSIIPKAINEGAVGSMGAIMNTACAVGFGSVVKVVSGFGILTTAMLHMPGSILFSESLAVNVLAGATGSASGGLSIALQALAPQYLQIAQSKGINPEYLHRIASISSGGLDSLPHNGAVLTLLAVSGCTHKESYMDIAVTTCIIPGIGSMLIAFILGLIVG